MKILKRLKQFFKPSSRIKIDLNPQLKAQIKNAEKYSKNNKKTN